MEKAFEELYRHNKEAAEQTTLVKAQQVEPDEEMIIGRKQAKLSYIKNLTLKIMKLQALYEVSDFVNRYGSATYDMNTQLAKLEELQDNNGIKTSELYGYWVTINPSYEGKDTTELTFDMMETVFRFIRKKGVFLATFVVEQGGTTEEEMGKHPHIHMLVQRNTTNQNGQPARLKKTIKSSFKKYGDQLDIKPCHMNNIEGRIRYLNGQKSDNKKYKSHEIDIKWRLKLDINPIYK